jgi:photosystem II stability/assembly factor-like uncharacterized protein
MPSRYRGFLMSAVLVAAATACSAGASADTIHTLAARHSAPQPVDVLSVSFVSPSEGWLLGEHGGPGSRALMRETMNGGRTWFAVPAPPAPAADMFQSSPPPNAVGSILFASMRDGWAFGPALWRTTDGGATWRRQRVPGPVADFETAGGRTLAVIRGTDRAGDTTFRVYTSAVGAGTWRPVAGTAVTGFSTESLAVSGQTGYLLAASKNPARPMLLTGPVTGAARWRPLPEPCPASWSAALAAAPGWLFAGCGNEPGAGNQLKTAYVSSDGGHRWHQVASPPLGGYLGRATMTPGGTIFLSGERMDVYISRDRGRSWHESPSLAGAAGLANAGFSLVGTPVTGTFGVAIQEGVGTQQVWLTRDGGRRWTPVTVH